MTQRPAAGPMMISSTSGWTALLVLLFGCPMEKTIPTSEPAPPPRSTSADTNATEVREMDPGSASLEHLAAALLAGLPTTPTLDLLELTLRLQSFLRRDAETLVTIARTRELRHQQGDPEAEFAYLRHELLAQAHLGMGVDVAPPAEILRARLDQIFEPLDDRQAYRALSELRSPPGHGPEQLRAAREQAEASGLRDPSANLAWVLEALALREDQEMTRHVVERQRDEDLRRYQIDDTVLVPVGDRVVLSAIVVRPHAGPARRPVALMSTIYPNLERNLDYARIAASYGYVGVVLDARGKRLSSNSITLYENDGADVNGALEWISRQAWCDGRIGMFGGSYSGYAQWAAAKYHHPALKTIVPAAAAIPGLGLPMENNVFLNANYGWAFYVGNNKMLDDTVYRDRARWWNLADRWYESGRPYREIDQVDGTPNPWLQKWLDHPSWDRYWQSKVPTAAEYAKIDIPVLSFTGYFDDGQISAIEYVKQHLGRRPNADHYLVIGPYDHFGSQWRPDHTLRGYEIDPSARIVVHDLIFAWFDHVFYDRKRPKLLQDRINFEVMGTNQWQHVAALPSPAHGLMFYLDSRPGEPTHRLSSHRPADVGQVPQDVDFRDRSDFNNLYYPGVVIRDRVDEGNGVVYVSDALTRPLTIVGTFDGELHVRINKRDLDVGVVLYEQLPDGRYFHLSYFLGRASYAKDPRRRHLLRPGREEVIPFSRTRMTAKKLEAGSRIVAVVNVNKNSGAQINYGTGKDVSDESIADANEPLHVDWLDSSFIRIPILAGESKGGGR